MTQTNLTHNESVMLNQIKTTPKGEMFVRKADGVEIWNATVGLFNAGLITMTLHQIGDRRIVKGWMCKVVK